MEQQNPQGSQVAQLARIDERTSILIDLVTQLQSSVDTKFSQHKVEFETSMLALRKEYDNKMAALEQSAVTQDQFWPIKTITYGQVGVVLLAVVVALLKFVIIGA